MRTCRKCFETKPVSEFYRHARNPDGIGYFCKACCKIINARWYLLNTEKAIAKSVRRGKEKPELVKAEHTRWRHTNKEHCNENKNIWKKNNPEKCIKHAEARAIVRKKNRAKDNSLRAKYRAAQLLATPGWADSVAILEKYEFAKLWSELRGIPYHVDHIVPMLSKIVCGLHVEHNLQVITAKENISKNNRRWPDMPEGHTR